MHVDTSLDFRSDTPKGKDPDRYSPKLRSYHKFLWSRDLPNGVRFTLDDDTPNEYLHHRSELGEFFLASDACLPTYHRYPAAASFTSRVPEVDRRHFDVITYTIGGMMIFPGDRRDGKMTINGAKGFHPRIRDRMDLTLECISRHYRQETSPLAGTLARYSDFFALFEDFRSYVDFFLLNDLITDDSDVSHFIPFDDFTTQPVPGDLDAYLLFCQRSIDFVTARNRRIEYHVAAADHTTE